MEDEYIKVVCNSCGKRYRVKNPEQPKRYRCPNCKNIIIVELYMPDLTEEVKPKITNSKEKGKKKFNIDVRFIWFSIARIVTVIMLFCALSKHPYSYYTILRFVVCGVSIYGVYFAYEINKMGWAWTFGIIALLFNPIIPIHLDKDTWSFIDVVCAVVFVISIFSLRRKSRLTNKKINILICIILVLIVAFLPIFISYNSNQVKILKTEVLKPKVLKPKVLKPKVLKPKVLKPKVLKPKVIETKRIRPQKNKENNYQVSKIDYQSLLLQYGLIIIYTTGLFFIFKKKKI